MTTEIQKEPRWPAFAALLATGCLYLGLPERLSIGPRWLLLVIILVLLVPIVVSHKRGHFRLNRVLTLIANGIITVAMIASLVFLVEGLPKHREAPEALLHSAAGLWLTNILVFALWYWRLDAGGPHQRERSKGNLKSAFLFPQMLRQTSGALHDKQELPPWSPQFLDYLFLAFNTSTAFSPSDTAILSRGAKVGMMTQSVISLSILALLAARAIGIL